MEYSDPNMSVEYVVDIQLKEWRTLAMLQKEMLLEEKLMNARTMRELKLARQMKTILKETSEESE